jgi:hypothetical protein
MACPVCFGGEDTVMRESLNAGIGVLMGVTTIVLAAFARFIVVLARRAREHARADQPPPRLRRSAGASAKAEAHALREQVTN